MVDKHRHAANVCYEVFFCYITEIHSFVVGEFASRNRDFFFHLVVVFVVCRDITCVITVFVAEVDVFNIIVSFGLVGDFLVDVEVGEINNNFFNHTIVRNRKFEVERAHNNVDYRVGLNGELGIREVAVHVGGESYRRYIAHKVFNRDNNRKRFGFETVGSGEFVVKFITFTFRTFDC